MSPAPVTSYTLGFNTFLIAILSLLLNVINNTYVSKNCEILPGIFTKTSGILSIKTKKNIIRELSVNTSILCYLLQLEYPTGYVLNTGEIIYKHFVQDLFFHCYIHLIQ